MREKTLPNSRLTAQRSARESASKGSGTTSVISLDHFQSDLPKASDRPFFRDSPLWSVEPWPAISILDATRRPVFRGQRKARSASRQLTLCCFVAASLMAATADRAQGINIHMIQAPRGTTDLPDFDSDLSQLAGIMNAAATYWESIFPHLGVDDIDIYYGYRDLDPGILAVAEVQDFDNQTGRPTQGAIAFDTTVNSQTMGDIDREWFFDPTPFDDSEFNMQQVLVRDLDPDNVPDYYNGSPPGLLEAGYYGNYAGSNLGDDIWSTALHEIGHILGVIHTLPDSETELDDGDYDFNPSWINNASAAAEIWDVPGDVQPEHLRSPHALMSVGAGFGDKTPSRCD